MSKNIRNKVCLLLIIYVLIILGNLYNFFFTPGLLFLLLSLLCLILLQQNRKVNVIYREGSVGLTAWILLFFITLSLVMYGTEFQNDFSGYISFSKALLVISIGISSLYIFNFSTFLPQLVKSKFFLLFAIAGILRVLVLLSSPLPNSDVYNVQKKAPVALISADNPYSLIYEEVDLDVFPYGPGVIFLNMPAVLFTGDPRYTMIFAELGTALLFFIMIKSQQYKFQNHDSKNFAELLPLIFLYQPKALFILAFAWVDPLLVFILTIFVFLLIYSRKNVSAFIALGLALSIKQYSILLIPFLLNSRLVKLRDLGIAVVTFTALCFPFLIWNAKDFFRDVFLYQITVQTPFYDSLSFNTLFHELSGLDIPLIVIILIEILIMLYLLKVQNKLRLSAIFLAVATLSLSTFLLYKLAFIHYYYFTSSLVLLAIVILVRESSVSKNTHQS